MISNLENNHEKTNLFFSPDHKHLITGTSKTKLADGSWKAGELVMFDRFTFERRHSVLVEHDESVICSTWHPILNQIALGLSSGICRVLFDPETSRNGALLCFDRKPKTTHVEDQQQHLSAKA
jgi:hypothetical protein